jgi:adenylate cyclase class 2
MENEIKILNVDPKAVSKRLEALGAQKVYEDNRVITHFDTPDGALAGEGKQVKVTQEGTVKLTVTSGVNTTTPTEEKKRIEGDINAIPELAGLQPISKVTAPRISYELGKIDFDIDTFPGIPPFLEIDTTDVDDLEALLTKLGLESNERVVLGTPGIYTRYGKDYFKEFRI